MTVTVAVYAVLLSKIEGDPLHVIAVVYWPLLVIDDTGVAPVTGAGITMLATFIVVALFRRRELAGCI